MDSPARRNDSQIETFFVLGSQYYALGRYAARLGFVPVCGSLFRQAVELLLLAYLVQHTPLTRLRGAGHDLSKLWYLFKAEASAKPHQRLDPAVFLLNQVVLLLAAEPGMGQSAGAQVSFAFEPGSSQGSPYTLQVADLDALVQAIFAACGVDPRQYFQNMPEVVRQALPQEFG